MNTNKQNEAQDRNCYAYPSKQKRRTRPSKPTQKREPEIIYIRRRSEPRDA